MPWMNITCGACGKTADLDAWTSRPISGDLPKDTFQCPHCNQAFIRHLGKPEVYPNGFIMPGPVSLVPCSSRL